jgi:threonine 3-dehydrogenase
MNNSKILVIGANGQLGTVLTPILQLKFGYENVIASDINFKNNFDGIFEILDATNYDSLLLIVKKYGIKQIYHLAAILSANGEKEPLRTWEINMRTLLNVLEVSRIENIEKIFYPSSIAVYGDSAHNSDCSQTTFLDPITVYGISKAAGENWTNYYFTKYGLDVRSLRFPGIIGYQSKPGGGTTDYAVEIFHKAIEEGKYNCFLKKDTRLPMIFMDDAVNATIMLMDAKKSSIKTRSSYNLAGMSFTPEEIANEIKKHIPDFSITYEPDFRQKIAESWPEVINDKEARADWGWQPKYNLKELTNIIISKLKPVLA